MIHHLFPAAEEVEGGSLTIRIKYKNYIPVMNKKEDLCNIPDILAESCPLQPGVHEATFIQSFPLPTPHLLVLYTLCVVYICMYQHLETGNFTWCGSLAWVADRFLSEWQCV